MPELCRNNTLFWDWDQTINGEQPLFSPCFLSSVPVWVIHGWIWIVSPFYMCYLVRQKTSPNPLSWRIILKTLLLTINIVLLIVEWIVEDASRYLTWKTAVFSFTLQTITLILVGFYIYMERWKGFVTSGVLFIYWTVAIIINTVPLYHRILLSEYSGSTLSLALFSTIYGIQWMQWILSCFAEIQKSNDKGNSPFSKSSFPVRLFFSWTFWVLIKGYRRTLTQDDVYPLDSNDRADYLFTKYSKCRKRSENNRRKRIKTRDKPPTDPQEEAGESLLTEFGHTHQSDPSCSHHSLLTILFKIFGWEYLKFHLLTTLLLTTRFTNPQLLSLLLEFLAEPGRHQLWWGYMLAVSLFVVSVTEVLIYSHSVYTAWNLGKRVGATLMTALYKKALTVSRNSKQTSSVGEILNLMSVDTSTIQDNMMFLGIWIEALVEIMLALYFLYEILGYAMFVGCGLLVLLVPMNAFLASRTFRVMQEQMKVRDGRINLLSEVINGIKVLKLYAWEMTFKNKIMDIRNSELKKLLHLKVLRRILEILFHITPVIVIFSTFFTYVRISDKPLDAKTAFVSLSLFNILRYAIDMMQIALRRNFIFFVAVKRINKFLNGPDIKEDVVQRNVKQEKAVEIRVGVFAWDGKRILEDVNVEIPEGSLVAVVGQVGQGKSSLLSAILGEMTKIRGAVSVKGSIAYVSQQAWIQNATIQDNILFGFKMDKERYNRIVEACGLTPDLKMFPAGDQTEIGEKGINLSGGQKQRVSLARAVYSDADIYLLDDPLSAVDSHVGRHIFEEVIGSSGLLKNKTCILVTHGIQWLPKVDEIIVLVDGKISETGSYDELLSHAGPFANFLENYLMNVDEKEIEDELRVNVLQRLTSLTSDETNGSAVDLRQSINDLNTKHLKMKSTSIIATERQTSVNLQRVTKKNNVKDNLIEEESTETGQVNWQRFMTYFRAISQKYCILLVMFYGLAECMNLLGNIWLSKWTEDPVFTLMNKTMHDANVQERNAYFLGSYMGFGIGQIISVVLYGILYVQRTTAASRTMHTNLLHSILRCPISFFDTTPSGRIINRFSKDMESIDIVFPWHLEMVMFCFISLLGVLVAITYSSPWFLLVAIPISILYYLLLNFYLPTSRQLRRISSNNRSPIYSYFSETLAGASVIRAFGKENEFMSELQRRVNDFHQVKWAEISVDGWRSIHVGILGCSVILAASIISVATRNSISAGMAGLSISYSLSVTNLLGLLVYALNTVETNAVSVERIAEYTDKASEADLVNADHRPPEDWPCQGQVILTSYSTRYRPKLDLVLKDINVTIKPGEKVGIVGRTGAGKSSLTLGLFRLMEPASGNIEIDGVKLTDIGLHDCRSKLTILPQDPVLFSGTLRMNIDPMDQKTDGEIWNALEHAHLKSFVQSLPAGLESECGESGGNLSVGQKQLVCLARSLLRKTKILILDEATAAVDLETDDLIQRTIREEFRECTVLTIAHRINTVMDYDRILVLDNGRLLESDTPQNLMADTKSLFHELAKNAVIIK
ncbi:multidrug resistance-associated protein 1-like [Saccostrea echinata]|uniref:multidrug resistance-associated protein 1-like n=1 Tax=Saccostrea echinata TaxID=191078 RepID=UPI002A80F06F|nr:multidrug resistance-associated protein 1-like [Saccostrea echinata]